MHNRAVRIKLFHLLFFQQSLVLIFQIQALCGQVLHHLLGAQGCVNLKKNIKIAIFNVILNDLFVVQNQMNSNLLLKVANCSL